MTCQTKRFPRGVMTITKVVGIALILMIVFAGERADARELDSGQCYTYTMEECFNSADCEEIAQQDTACGSALGPQCTGKGWVACGHHTGCEDADDVAMVCYFETEQ